VQNKPFIQKFNSLINKTIIGLNSLIVLEDGNGSVVTSEPRQEIKTGIEYQSDYTYLSADPRIMFIQNILRHILSRSILIYKKNQIMPYSFRLKHLRHWLVRTNISNLLIQLAWDCKIQCKFCNQKSNPPLLRIKRRIPREEIETRIKYFMAGKDIISGYVFANDEILNHPNIIWALKELRKKDKNENIEITTNGRPLTPKIIKTLKTIMPVSLYISLVSASPKTRLKLMGDYNPEIAISSLPLLKKYKIPFVVNIVAAPDLPRQYSPADNHAGRQAVDLATPRRAGMAKKKPL
jgi:hypothetical protein